MKPSFWHLPLLLLAVWASPAPAQTAAAATTAPGAARVSKGEAQALKIFRMLDADGYSIASEHNYSLRRG